MHDLVNTGQPWLVQALAGQEEHLRRVRPCVELGVHVFVTYRPDRPGSFYAVEAWQACRACGVTQTPQDHERQLAARAGGA